MTKVLLKENEPFDVARLRKQIRRAQLPKKFY